MYIIVYLIVHKCVTVKKNPVAWFISLKRELQFYQELIPLNPPPSLQK